ncbi:MAG: CRTAC1 family protein [Sandaracinus sp.]
MRRALRLACLFVLVPSCGTPAATTPTIPIIAGPGTRWALGMQAFEEHTHDVGLDGALGTRIHAIDYDGDGWTDLFVLNGRAVVGDGLRWSRLLRNDQHGSFVDVTAESHILARRSGDAQERPVDVAVFGDVDGDGDLDAYLGVSTENPTNNGNEHSELVLQNADHTFSLAPETTIVRPIDEVIGELTDSPSGASFVDYDVDGDLDLFVSEYGFTTTSGSFLVTSRLYENDGAGGFHDVTTPSGVLTQDWIRIDDIDAGLGHPRAWSANACDLNDDGLPDLLAASYGRAPNHLWQATREGTGPVTYTNRSVASGYAYDDEMDWTDNQFALCFCQSTPTSAGCPANPRPVLQCPSPAQWDPSTDTHAFRLGGNSGATMCGDVDNDGDLDLLTSEIQHWWAGDNSDHAELLVNDGQHDVTFDRPGRDAMGIVIPHDDPNGWNEGIMSGAIFDFDNDGWLDLYFGMSDYAGNHGVLVHQTSALHFESVPIAQGIDHHRSHGIGVADFDRDGDLDVVVGHSRARCDATAPDDCYPTQQIRYFRNVIGGNFIQLHLVGTTANRPAIGARVALTIDGVTQRHDVEGGHGHYSAQDDLVQHFGLGTGREADVEIRWPAPGLPTQAFHVVAGHRYRVVQGEAPVLEDVTATSP